MSSRVKLISLFVLGVGLLFPFDSPVTLILGVGFLFAFVVYGLFAIAEPAFLERDRDDDPLGSGTSRDT